MVMHEWKSDNYKFVGKAFDYAYANRMNKLSPLFSEEKSNSVDYEMTGTEGYGELQRYDGSNLNKVKAKRGFKTVITTDEFVGDEILTRKQARIDKFGSTQRIGKRLGDSAAMTVYQCASHVLRCIQSCTHRRRRRKLGKRQAPHCFYVFRGQKVHSRP